MSDLVVMFPLKPGSRHRLWLARLILLSLAVAGCAFPVHSKNDQRSETSEHFLAKTERGKVVLTYLRCTDFDCVEALQGVVGLGSDVVPALINLLQGQVPQMIAPDLPKDKLALLVRPRIINALGKLKDERAVEVLLKSVEDKLPQIRAAATEALGEVGNDRALPAVILRLQDRDQFVRETAAKALGRLQRSETLEALNIASRKESVPHVRQAMEAAIKSIQQRHAGP